MTANDDVSATTIRCRRCQCLLAEADDECPLCGIPLKALFQLGTLPNGYQVKLYLNYDEHGPQIAVLGAILSKFEEQGRALEQIRDLHKPRWDNCLNACCPGDQCKHRSRSCEGGCDEYVNDQGDYWPCATACLAYSADELASLQPRQSVGCERADGGH